MSDWEKCAIADLCDSISETYHRNSPNVVLINTSDVLEGNILNHEFVPNKQLKGQFKKTFQKEDILFSEIRPANKRYAFVDIENTQDYIASTKLMVLRPDKKKVLPMYLYFLLTAKNMLDELQYLAETRSGTFPQITFDSELGTMPVVLPDIITQAKIAGILKALDGKIALNQQINKNLEEQTQAIFASYFITDNSFEKLKKLPLSDLCTTITKGTTPTTLGKPFVDSGINFIKAESILDNHSIDTAKFAFIDEDTHLQLNRSIIHNKDILFTIAGTLGRFAFVDNSVLPANTNQAVAIIRADAEKITPEYLYSFFIGNWHNDYYTKRIQQAVQANLSLTTIKSLPIPILPTDSMKKYLNVIIPIIAMIKHNENENRRLMSVRDALLPRLMSGEIDVSKIEA